MAKILKVVYFNSNDLAVGFRCELDIEDDQLVALEIYSNGSCRFVVVRNGIVDYILKGEDANCVTDEVKKE